MHEKFLTIAEVAKLLRISERSAYKAAAGGTLPGAVKVGGQWRVNRKVLEEWTGEGGRHQPTSIEDVKA